ncbi:MAG: O-antigen ligase family protein [Bacteroidales bacterium]|nr:O-antigen ligase family protein [Bacteroidales bacterium]
MIIGLIAFSGFPFFYKNDNYLVIFFLFGFLVWIMRSRHINKKTLFYFIGFVIIILAQTIKYRFFPSVTIMGYFIRIFIAFFVLESIGIEEMLKKYLKTILFFSLISLILYVPLLFDDSIITFYNNNAIPLIDPKTDNKIGGTLLIFHLRVNDIHSLIVRNPGPFWEPGAFAGFLIIGILFNKIKNDRFFNIYGVMFLITLISTLSTTGYITYMFILIAFSLNSKRGIVVALLLSIVFIYIYSSLPFLREKIKNEYNIAFNSNLEKRSKNRIASTIVDINDVKNNLLFGRGPNDLTRYDNPFNSKVNNRNNGITDFLVKFGLVGFFLYFISMYYSLEKVCVYYDRKKKTLVICFISILLIGSSELYFMYPFFFALSLLHTVNSPEWGPSPLRNKY